MVCVVIIADSFILSLIKVERFVYSNLLFTQTDLVYITPYVYMYFSQGQRCCEDDHCPLPPPAGLYVSMS
jgi:hypothetical protein